MDHQTALGKIASDRNNRELGKIIKIEEIPDEKTKVPKEHLLVHVKNFLRRDVVIVIDANLIENIDDRYVWIDILKEDFDQEVRETRALIRLYGEQ